MVSLRRTAAIRLSSDQLPRLNRGRRRVPWSRSGRSTLPRAGAPRRGRGGGEALDALRYRQVGGAVQQLRRRVVAVAHGLQDACGHRRGRLGLVGGGRVHGGVRRQGETLGRAEHLGQGGGQVAAGAAHPVGQGVGQVGGRLQPLVEAVQAAAEVLGGAPAGGVVGVGGV